MKKELFFIIVTFAMSSVYSQVGIDTAEPTAQLDINGSWRFRQATQNNSTQTISAILGTYYKNNAEDGHVNPNRINVGLRSSVGMFKVFPNMIGGLIVDPNGLAINPFHGLTINNSLLNIVPNQDKGIRLNNNQLTAEIGNGLQFNLENVIGIRPKLDGGIVIDNEGVGVKNGRAINTDANGLSVGYDNGITLSADNKLVVDLDYINGQNNTNLGKIGDGLEYQKIEENYLVSVEPGNGLTINTEGLAIKPSKGLVVNQNGVNVKPYNGVDVSTNGLSVKTQSTSGLLVDSNGLSIKPGKGIETTTRGLDVKPGNGTSIYVDILALNTGIGTYNDDDAKLRLKLSPNSSLGLDDNGLKLQIEKSGGLKIENNSLGIVNDNSLQIESNNTIGVNVDTSRGLAVDANGLHAKLGLGLEFDSNKNIAKVSNPLVATAANNGLEKSGNKVLLGEILNKPVTIIETNNTNTLALASLEQNNSTSNKQLVIDSNNNIRTTNIDSNASNYTLPTIITLDEDIPNFMANATSYPWNAQNQTVGWKFTINSIPLTMQNVTITNDGISAQGTKLIFPPGTYQVIYNLQFKFTGYLPCKVNSYFAGVPIIDRSASMSISHIPGELGKTINFGGSTTYTFKTTQNLDYLLSFGLTQNINNDCHFNTNGSPTLKKNGTQIIIYKYPQ